MKHRVSSGSRVGALGRYFYSRNDHLSQNEAFIENKYPNGLSEVRCPVSVRCFAVLVVVDAQLTNSRSMEDLLCVELESER